MAMSVMIRRWESENDLRAAYTGGVQNAEMTSHTRFPTKMESGCMQSESGSVVRAEGALKIEGFSWQARSSKIWTARAFFCTQNGRGILSRAPLHIPLTLSLAINTYVDR